MSPWEDGAEMSVHELKLYMTGDPQGFLSIIVHNIVLI